MNRSILGIAIPVYNQPKLLTSCLQSLSDQSNQNFQVYIHDDASSEDYSQVLSKYRHLNIHYYRATKNRGALLNFVYAYNQTAPLHGYVMKLHEDDQLAPTFVESVLNSIAVGEQPALVISKFECFPEHLAGVYKSTANTNGVLNLSKVDLCFRYIKNEAIAFGSAVYNTSFFPEMDLDLKKYAEFADRPFILNHLRNSHRIKFIDAPLYYYRNHENDKRWKALQEEHIFNLLKLYQQILNNSGYATSFRKLATGFIVDSYQNLVLTGKAPWFPKYIYRAYREQLISTKYLLLKNSLINRTVTAAVSILK